MVGVERNKEIGDRRRRRRGKKEEVGRKEEGGERKVYIGHWTLMLISILVRTK